MDKYDRLPSRTERNKELYNTYENQTYDKFDINSNQEVLKDNARKINVDQIRDILDKKYNDNAPKRRTIDIRFNEKELKEEEKEDTKEYDLNEILNKAKKDSDFNYDRAKLNTASDINKIVNEVKSKYPNREDTEESKELVELIKTVTILELENSKKDADLLGLSDTMSIPKDKIVPDNENTFYTGELKVKDNDFEDFSDIESSIKSNNIMIKILIFIFILVAIAIGVVVANSLFELGLF